MDVILLKDVEKVGLKGDVVERRARLRAELPAAPASGRARDAGRLAELERHQELRARHEAQTVEQAQDTAQALEDVELRFECKAGPTGSLFGSVTATDIADELWNGQRIRVDRRKIDLHDPLKRIGRLRHPARALHRRDRSTLRVLVVPEGGELPPEEELQAPKSRRRGSRRSTAEEIRSGEEPAAAEQPATEAPPPRSRGRAPLTSRRQNRPRRSRRPYRPPKPPPRSPKRSPAEPA